MDSDRKQQETRSDSYIEPRIGYVVSSTASPTSCATCSSGGAAAYIFKTLWACRLRLRN